MNAVTKQEAPGEIADYSGGLLAVIERASRDPSVDIEKLERLFALKERMDARDAKQSFIEGKIAMRAQLPEITMKGLIRIPDKNKPGHFLQETPFARFEDIHEAIMPVLTAHGFDLSFRNGLAPDGKVRVTTILSHRDGHEESTDFDLPHDGSGSKNAVQAVGSSTSYGKRYGVLSILNIKVAGEDDDGVTAMPETVIEIEKPKDRPFPQGPAKNKTDLKAQGRDLWREIEACGDADMLDILLSDNKALLDQIKDALPSWWSGGEGANGERFEGLEAVVARIRNEGSRT